MKALQRTFGLISTLSLLLLGTTFVGTASAANIACGATIVQNTVLDADIGPCGQGITIGADNTPSTWAATRSGARGPGWG